MILQLFGENFLYHYCIQSGMNKFSIENRFMIKIPAQQRRGHSLTAWNAVKMANWEKLQNVMDWRIIVTSTWLFPRSHQISAKLRYASIYLIMRGSLFLVRL